MIGIKAKDSKNITVTNSIFSNLGTAIELVGVEDFTSENNQFLDTSDPQFLLSKIIEEINLSKIDNSSKAYLSKQVISLLTENKNDSKKNEVIKEKLFCSVGAKAVDYFVQLLAAVSAGFVLGVKK
jgi:hypothetical protein